MKMNTKCEVGYFSSLVIVKNYYYSVSVNSIECAVLRMRLSKTLLLNPVTMHGHLQSLLLHCGFQSV